ncbi:MAG: PH domain-containing protein [Firmicutes bacterium]|nr:PH domain-containing protein [Bacillota bacterium]
MASKNNIDNVEFEIKWEGQPQGLWQRFLSILHLNFTYYQITKDELIIKTGFFRQKVNTIELYLLKDPDYTVTLYQRLLGIGTISVMVDSKSSSNRAGEKIYVRNIKDCEKVRKLLRDSIEDDVMERKITYIDRV